MAGWLDHGVSRGVDHGIGRGVDRYSEVSWKNCPPMPGAGSFTIRPLVLWTIDRPPQA